MCLLSRFACGLLVFSAWWPVPFLLALSRAPGLQSFFSFSSAQISLSLSLGLSCSCLSPLGFTGWGLCLSWLLSWLGLSLAISWWPTYWYPCISFRFSSGRSFPPSWWGPALLLRWTSFQSVLLVIRGISCSSWLSPLHSARFWFIVFSVPCGWVGALLPSVWLAPGLSLFGLLAVPQFLLSRFLAVCFPGLWVSLFPGSFLVLGSSFPVLVFYSFLLRGTAVASGSCLLLLWGASSYSHVWSLVSVSCDGFSDCSVGSKVFSYFSGLVFCSSQSCLGLQWFWSSCPFRCWGSRLPLPIALFRISSRGLGSFLFPDFVPGWLVLRLLRWCSAVSSCFPAFSRLADPCSFYSPALSLCSILGGSALHVFLLLAFGPLGWLFILSPSPWSTRCFCWCVPPLPSCSVGPPGSPRLALPLRSGVLLPGCTCSVSSVCIDLASFLSCSSGVLRPGGCFPWLVSSSMVVFVHSSHVRPLWSCDLLCVSSLSSPPWSWLCCFLRLHFIRRLSLSVVFLVPSRWGHPSMGRV